MSAPFGAIITLDPAFLRYFSDRVDALKEYKLMLKSGKQPPSASSAFLQILETEYGVQVENL
ncbi:MAG: hypothetical protein NT028_08190 [candidate division Zixibacteria bacterium]|nr:hypothetical protein [candidate division Zixibacteria bacterium]